MANDVEATIIIPETIIRGYENHPMTKWCCETDGRYSDCNDEEFCLHKVLTDNFEHDQLDPLVNRLLYRVGGYTIEDDRVHFVVANEMSPLFAQALSMDHPDIEVRAAYFDDCSYGIRSFTYKNGSELANGRLGALDDPRKYLIDFKQVDLMGFFERGVFPEEEAVRAAVGEKSALLVLAEDFEAWQEEQVLEFFKENYPRAECFVNFLNSVLMITDDFADIVTCKLNFNHEILWSYHDGKLRAQK